MQHDGEPDAPCAIVVQGPIDEAMVAALTERVRAIIGSTGAETPVVCEMGTPLALDESALDALVRLQLTAHRLGGSIVLRNARGELVDLLALVGLSDVIREER